MDQNTYDRRSGHASNVKARHNLERVSKYWDMCKEEKANRYDRDHKELEHHLLDLAIEYDQSCLELEELKRYLLAMEQAEDDTSTLSLTPDQLVERRAVIEECRRGIQKILKRPKRAHPAKADVTRTAFPSAPTAHEVAMRILRSGTVKRRRRPRPVLPDSTEVTDYGEGHVVRSNQTVNKAVQVSSNDLAEKTHKKAVLPPRPKSPVPAVRFPSITNDTDVDNDVTDLQRFPPRPPGSGTVKKQLAAASMPTFAVGLPSSGELRWLASKKTQSVGTRRGIALKAKPKSTLHDSESDVVALERYCQLLSLEKSDDFRLPRTSTCRFTDERIKRRRLLDIEALLRHLPSFQRSIQMADPREHLNCRYLRLTASNIAELEGQCRERGYDPGVHAHMTVEEVLDYFQQHPKNEVQS